MFLWTGKMYLHIAQFEDNLPLFALSMFLQAMKGQSGIHCEGEHLL